MNEYKSFLCYKKKTLSLLFIRLFYSLSFGFEREKPQQKMIVAICGFPGAGKDTVAAHLVENHGFVKVSFASVLKDVVAVLFGWPRDKLEGITAEDRAWREVVDPWWSHALQMPHLTPRFVLQYFGTDLLRNHFHPDMWVLTAMRSIEMWRQRGQHNIVITDLRFQNEAQMLLRLQEKEDEIKIVHLFRGDDVPAWYKERTTKNHFSSVMDSLHASDKEWPCFEADHVWLNRGSIADLCELSSRELFSSSQK